MRKFLFLVIAALHFAIIGLCVYDHICLRGIRSDFHALAISPGGPLYDGPSIPESNYGRIISAREIIVNKSMARYATIQRLANMHTAIAILVVASSFLSFFLVGRLKQETNRVRTKFLKSRPLNRLTTMVDGIGKGVSRPPSLTL